MYGPVLGATTTTTAALALPNAGGNTMLGTLLIVTMIAGTALTVAGLAKLNASRVK